MPFCGGSAPGSSDAPLTMLGVSEEQVERRRGGPICAQDQYTNGCCGTAFPPRRLGTRNLLPRSARGNAPRGTRFGWPEPASGQPGARGAGRPSRSRTPASSSSSSSSSPPRRLRATSLPTASRRRRRPACPQLGSTRPTSRSDGLRRPTTSPSAAIACSGTARRSRRSRRRCTRSPGSRAGRRTRSASQRSTRAAICRRPPC